MAGREGPGEIVVRDGILEAVTWLDGADADGIDATGVVVAPGFIDLHAHLREPGNEDAETIATGLAAAAHGGFTTVCAMPNTTPTLDEPGVLARIRAAAAASGSPVELLAIGAVTTGRAGETLAAIGELADDGVVGFSDDGAPVRSAAILRNALAYAGALGLPIIDHPEDPTLTDGAEANEGLVATVLGLRGWPGAAESGAVARAIAILDGVVVDVPGARLHLTHVSTAASLELIRDAKARDLPVTCDVTPHHLALTDEWVAGREALVVGCPGRGWRGPGSVGGRRARRGAVLDVDAREPAAARTGGRGGLPGRAARRHGRRGRHGPRAAHRGRQGGRVRERGQRDQRHRDRPGAAARAGRRGASAAARAPSRC